MSISLKISETQFKKIVMRNLKSLGKPSEVWVLKTQERGRKGVPDLIVCFFGAFMAIELKKESEEPSPLQYIVLDEIDKAGGVAFWTCPSRWENDFKLLKDMLQ